MFRYRRSVSEHENTVVEVWLGDALSGSDADHSLEPFLQIRQMPAEMNSAASGGSTAMVAALGALAQAAPNAAALIRSAALQGSGLLVTFSPSDVRTVLWDPASDEHLDRRGGHGR